MELKATFIGRQLAQHPYDRVRVLPAGIEVCGKCHRYLIPFNQLIAIACKRGVFWGELEFTLSDGRYVRLHGTRWKETQIFYADLNRRFLTWSQEMGTVCQQVLCNLNKRITQFKQQQTWISQSALELLEQAVRQDIAALPVPEARLNQFPDCKQLWSECQGWLQEATTLRCTINHRWANDLLLQYKKMHFASRVRAFTLEQCEVIFSEAQTILVTGPAGCGKTLSLLLYALQRIQERQSTGEQILILAATSSAKAHLTQLLSPFPLAADATIKTLIEVTVEIANHIGDKSGKISQLEASRSKRLRWLEETWRAVSNKNRVQAKRWHQWIDQQQSDIAQVACSSGGALPSDLIERIESELACIRSTGGRPSAPVDTLTSEQQQHYKKMCQLMMPLLKAWNKMLRGEGARDSNLLVQQAMAAISRQRFVSPWKYILVDDLQSLSLQQVNLLQMLSQQNSKTTLLATCDTNYTAYYSKDESTLAGYFCHHFGAKRYALRALHRIDENAIAASMALGAMIAQHKIKNSVFTAKNRDKLALVSVQQVETLLDKLSGATDAQEEILILAQQPACCATLKKKAATRWPKSNINFSSIYDCIGIEADYVIVLGTTPASETLYRSIGDIASPRAPGFKPGLAWGERAYIALTRARKKTWLCIDKHSSAATVHYLSKCGVATSLTIK